MYNIDDIIGTNKIISKDVEKTKKMHHGTYWQVECIYCGNIRSVRSDNLKNKCRSCAAILRDKNTRIIDNLIGKNFGFWEVIDKDEQPNYWVCKCKNCGTIKSVFRGALTQGQSKSCGCVSSWGETQISYWLNYFGIKYQKEFTFQDFKTKEGGTPRFDFAIMKNDTLYCLIEYDGRQHSTYNKNWSMTLEDFKRLQYIDNLKNQYCNKHNILLYRFTKNSIIKDEIEKISTLVKE